MINKLNELAKINAQKWYDGNIWGRDEGWNKRCYKDGFKDGYRTAKEE